MKISYCKSQWVLCQFRLCIHDLPFFGSDVNSVEHDNLRIDVWDFNPEENVSEKFKKFGDIKDSRGLRKFIKETLHASAGKTTYDLLGSVEIPLKVSFEKKSSFLHRLAREFQFETSKLT